MKTLFILLGLVFLAVCCLLFVYQVFLHFYASGLGGILLLVGLCLGLSLVFGMILVFASRYLRGQDGAYLSSLQMQQLPGVRKFVPKEDVAAGKQLPPVIELEGQTRRTPVGQAEDPRLGNNVENVSLSGEGLRSTFSEQAGSVPGAGDDEKGQQEPTFPGELERDLEQKPQAAIDDPWSDSELGAGAHWIGKKRSADHHRAEPTHPAEEKAIAFSRENAGYLYVEQRKEIRDLVEQCKKQLAQIDDRMMKHLSSNTAGSIEGVVNLRKIVTALEKRGQQIDELLQPGAIDFDRAKELYCSELAVEAGSVSSLLDSKPLPPISASEWRPAINELLHGIAQSATIFKGMDIGLAPRR